MTAKMKELLDFLRDYHDTHGIAPSFDEMNEHLGLNSKSGIHRLLNCLQDRGKIQRIKNRARAIELLDTPPAVVSEHAAFEDIRRTVSRFDSGEIGYLTALYIVDQIAAKALK